MTKKEILLTILEIAKDVFFVYLLIGFLFDIQPHLKVLMAYAVYYIIGE